MKMTVQFFFLAMVVSANASAAVHNKDVWRARDKGAEFDVVFRIVDDEGSPVVGARCGGWIYMERDRDHGCGYAEYADTNGCVRIVGKCSEWFSVVVRKEGYYRTMFDVKYPAQDANPPIVDGKWQPYGETRTVVLKRIKKPTAVSVLPSSLRDVKIPAYGVWVGFDFERADWCSPYGNGKFDDVLLRFTSDVRKRNFDFTYRMEASFTNCPYAGAYLMKKDGFSDLKSVYSADTNAAYVSTWAFSTLSDPSKPVILNYLNKDSYLVFRTRTQVDANGNLVGAHYGKIYGEWHTIERAMKLFDGCFNPVENDTNIEGDRTLLYNIHDNKKAK